VDWADFLVVDAASDLRLDLDMGICEVRLPRQDGGRRLPAYLQEAISGLVNEAASGLLLDLDMGIYYMRLPGGNRAVWVQLCQQLRLDQGSLG
jgi:hypothetical protein